MVLNPSFRLFIFQEVRSNRFSGDIAASAHLLDPGDKVSPGPALPILSGSHMQPSCSFQLLSHIGLSGQILHGRLAAAQLAHVTSGAGRSSFHNCSASNPKSCKANHCQKLNIFLLKIHSNVGYAFRCHRLGFSQHKVLDPQIQKAIFLTLSIIKQCLFVFLYKCHVILSTELTHVQQSASVVEVFLFLADDYSCATGNKKRELQLSPGAQIGTNPTLHLQTLICP